MKTSELTGAALDWAVAQCESLTGNYWVDDAGLVNWETDEEYGLFNPSGDWAQGGPIIEREGISVRMIGKSIDGLLWDALSADELCEEEGPTPLIAAMRCYVASKLGDEVEIPEDLC